MSIVTDTKRPLSAFEDLSFKNCWYEHLAEKFNVIEMTENFVIYPKPAAKGLFHLRELRLAGWNTAWSQVIDDNEIAVLQALLKKKNWDVFKIIVQEDRMNDALLQFKSAIFVPQDPEYFIRIENGWDNYLKNLPRKIRQNFQRLLRQIEPLNTRVQTFETDEEINRFFQIFIRHHQNYWQQKNRTSYFEDTREQAFFIAWAKALFKTGNLKLEALVLNDEIANLTMDVVYQNTRLGILTVNTGIYPKHQPGLVSLILKLQQAESQGISLFDLGYGQEAFKKDYANETRQRVEFILPNTLSWIGKGYNHWLKKRCALSTMSED